MTSPSSLPSGWREVTLGEVAENIAMGPFGSSIKVETFVPEGTPIISGQHLHGSRVDDSPGFNYITAEHASRLARAKVRRGDIVLTHRGNIGQVAYIPTSSEYEEYVVSQSQFLLRCDQSVALPEFVTMYLHSRTGQHKLLANASQVGVPSIAQPVTYLRTIEIPLPPLEEQREIVMALGAFDDKIELNRRMIETLEAMARALFKSWFVDFEPVRAKTEGRWHPGESLPGLPAKYFALFPGRLVPSQLGDIPEGWEVRPLGEVVSFHDSQRVPLNSRQRAARQGSYPYYGATGVMDYVDDYLFDGIFILVGEDGTVVTDEGLAVAQYVWGQIWVNNHAHVLTGSGSMSNEHLYMLAKEIEVQPYVTGAVQPKLSQTNLKSIPLVAAPNDVQRTYSEMIQPLFTKIRTVTDESRALAEQRDALLPRLVSGEVRV